MLRFIKSFFKKQHNLDVPETVPYKVETPPVPPAPPEPAKCGCGRSATGFCVGLHKLTAEEWAVHQDNPNKTAPVVVEAKAKKPVAKKAPAKKPAAMKAPAKQKPNKKTPV